VNTTATMSSGMQPRCERGLITASVQAAVETLRVAVQG
jgi:hypothetical protein